MGYPNLRPHLNLLLAVGTFPSRWNCFRVTAQRGDGRMSCSVDCLRHADRCAALAEKAIDRETRIMWIRMKLRWLRRAERRDATSNQVELKVA